MKVFFEDNHLIGINKESGTLVQPDNGGDLALEQLVKEYIKEKYQKPGEVFLGVIHRIDRPVSGLVLMARTSKALERMNKAFKDREVQKTYLAIVRNRPAKEEGTLIHWLTRDQQKGITKAHNKEVNGSQRAELHYKLLSEVNGFYLLEIKPITGRTHQIRVQLSSMNCPIVGDNKYGYPRGNIDKSICLHSYKLAFTHPVTKEQMELVAEVPGDEFWQKVVFSR
jgi:23S rRNA pseudouridine1911/1915/1917 synthase